MKTLINVNIKGSVLQTELVNDYLTEKVIHKNRKDADEYIKNARKAFGDVVVFSK